MGKNWLPLVLWGEGQWNLPEDARGTDDSRVIMTSRQAAQKTPATPHIPLVQRPPQKMFLWALLYLAGPVHTASMWTLPGWAGHCTQQNLQVRTCPFTLTPTHTATHHAYSHATTKIYPSTIKTLILCHPTCISSPWGYIQLVYTYLERYVNTSKCTTIKVNVILVAFIFPFSTLYIGTFSHVDYWDHNRGMSVSYMASWPSLTSWNIITWSPTPIHCPKATSHGDAVPHYSTHEASVYRFFKWLLHPIFSYGPRKSWPITIKCGSPLSQDLITWPMCICTRRRYLG